MRGLWLSGLLLCGCMPPPVKALDQWLEAYVELDTEQLVKATTPKDRALLSQALLRIEEVPRPTVVRALPERPLRYEITDIETQDPDRWRIATKLTLPNPLAETSGQVGYQLPNVPTTRPLRRRFLVIRTQDQWGVRLDLDTVVKRAELTDRILGELTRGRWKEAERLLEGGVPPPPDNGHGLKGKDRLTDELKLRIEKLRARTSTVSP